MGRPQKAPNLTPDLLAGLLRQGHSQRDIAKVFSVSEATLSRRVRVLKKRQIPSSEQEQPPRENPSTTGATITASLAQVNDGTSVDERSL